MIGYKGLFCLAMQYMLQIKYAYDFEIYCGRNGNGAYEPRKCCTCGSVATDVVLNLVNVLEGKRHVVVTVNYFTSDGLYMGLASREIYSIGIVQSNCVGVPRPLNNLRNWRESD
jgi:hypothetical protein